MAKKKSTQSALTNTPSRRLLDGLAQADTRIRRKAWPQARVALANRLRNYPREPQVLDRLVNVKDALNDMLAYQSAAERLLAADPGEYDLQPALAFAYLPNGLPTLALRSLRRFLQLAPNHPKAGDARAMLADLERGIPVMLAELGAGGDASLKLADMHEEVQSYLNQGEYARARQAALGVLRQEPDIAPVLNRHEDGVTQAYAADVTWARRWPPPSGCWRSIPGTCTRSLTAPAYWRCWAASTKAARPRAVCSPPGRRPWTAG